MRQFDKHFTLKEARALLPELRRIFATIHRHKAVLDQAEESLKRELERTGGDVGGEIARRHLAATAGVQAGILKISVMGIQIKDLERGLVDFPALIGGREVFLCWEQDEEDIEFWHDLETGYPGRERL